jgi:hypothetical protein
VTRGNRCVRDTIDAQNIDLALPHKLGLTMHRLTDGMENYGYIVDKVTVIWNELKSCTYIRYLRRK